MKFINSPYEQEDILDLYKQIEERQYYDKVRFYWEYKNQIELLDDSDQIALRIEVCEAYFEISQYNDVIEVADPLLEDIIIKNVFIHKGNDAFQKVLFKKAAAHYNLEEYQESKQVLKELLRLKPEHKLARYLFKEVVFKQRKRRYTIIHGMGVAFLLFGLLFYALNSLFFLPYYGIEYPILNSIPAAGFVMGLGTVILNELKMKWIIYRSIKTAIFGS